MQTNLCKHETSKQTKYSARFCECWSSKLVFRKINILREIRNAKFRRNYYRYTAALHFEEEDAEHGSKGEKGRHSKAVIGN